MQAPLSFKGRFQWWSYTVSHGQLLLRRTKSALYKTRIDVLFKNVAAVQLTAVCDDIVVTQVGPDAIPNLKDQLGALELADRKVYMVRGANCNGFVVAGSVSWNEDEQEYYEPSKLLVE